MVREVNKIEDDLIIRFHLSSCPLIKKGLCGRGVGAPISHPTRGQENPIKGLESLETSHSKPLLPVTFSILLLQEPGKLNSNPSLLQELG